MDIRTRLMKNKNDSLAFVVLNQEANKLCFVLSIAEEGRPIFALGQRLSWFSDEDHSPLVT